MEYCRHCGEPAGENQTGNWLCENCERYQNSVLCPMCKSVVDVDSLGDNAPKAAKPRVDKGDKE